MSWSGIADPRHDVPVVARPAAQRQRRARRDHVQPPLRVQRVAEPEQVVLVGATAVVEDQQALGLTGGGPFAVDRAHRTSSFVRGLTTGVSSFSSCGRRCSCCLGRRSASPRCSGVLVDREARRERRDLEQDPARLAEVDRLEVVAVAHVAHAQRRPRPRAPATRGGPRHARPTRCGARCPAPSSRALGGRRVVAPAEAAEREVVAVRARSRAASVSTGCGPLCAVRPRAHDAGDRERLRDLRMHRALAARRRRPPARSCSPS